LIEKVLVGIYQKCLANQRSDTLKEKYKEENSEKVLKDLEKEYGIPSVEVFFNYVNHNKLDIPKKDLVKWVHNYIVHNKHKMEVR